MRGQALQSVSGMQMIGKSYINPVSKYRHTESAYWTNKLNKRRKLARIQKKSRQVNAL